MGKPILCLDFDGVLHAYTSGWQGVTNIPDGPVPGAAQFIADAQQHFTVHVYSSRSESMEGITAMSAHLLGWLKEGLGGERGYEVWQRVVFPTYKPAAMVGIDDRVITFNGTWPNPADLRHFKPWNKREESNMERYAKEELALLRKKGGNEPDEMQDAIEANVLGIVREFSSAGHSGGSAPYTIGMLEKLLMFRPITPLTGEDDEWFEVGDQPDVRWQNTRCPTVFKQQDGSAYDIEAVIKRYPDGWCSSNGRTPITFPYTPATTYLDVDAEGKPVVDPEVQQRADILLALEAALVLLGRNEPGDSRAVSDQFVAMGSAVAGCMNEEGRMILHKIISEANNEPWLKAKGTPSVVFADSHAPDPFFSGCGDRTTKD